jgi:nitrogen fixation NifU-like protein
MALKVQGYCENTWCGHVIYFSNSQADGQVKLFTASQSDAVTPFYNLVAMYSAPTLDHFQNPRNAGDLPDPDAAVEIENPACGDVLRLTLKFSSGRISEVRFKAKGCVPAMACGSALTELVSGKTVEDARKLRRKDIVAAVGGLPQASSHAAQLALDALSAALNQLPA